MLTLEIKDKVVLVTGSNRGIGKSFVEKALELGAAKVYATARSTDSLADLAAANPERVVLLNLDICNQEQVDAVAAAARSSLQITKRQSVWKWTSITLAQ